MSDEFKLTEEQEAFIIEKTGVDDLKNVKIIFQVESINTKSVKDDFTVRSAMFSFEICQCDDGRWKSSCCPR